MLPIVWCLYGCVVNALSKMISGSRPNGWFSKRIRRSSLTTSRSVLNLSSLTSSEAIRSASSQSDQRQILRRHRLPVDRRVLVGLGVGLAADARDPRRMLIGPDVLRALEHQVLEQMREPGAAGLLVLRADVIPDREMHDRRRVIFEKDDLQAVGQRGHRVVELGRPDDGPARVAPGRAAPPRPTSEAATPRRAKHAAIMSLQARFEAASRASRSASTRRSSGRRRTSATLSRHSATSPAGMPATCSPVGDVLRHGRLGADARAAAELDVAGRPRLTRHHHVVVEHRAAGDADCAASSTLRPIFTPCATCTRLSIFVPRRCASRRRPADRPPCARRSRRRPRSTTRPTCGIFWCVPSGAAREAEAVAADDGRVLQDDAIADRDAARESTRAREIAVGADRRVGADDDVRVDDDRARADARARRRSTAKAPIETSGPTSPSDRSTPAG